MINNYVYCICALIIIIIIIVRKIIKIKIKKFLFYNHKQILVLNKLKLSIKLFNQRGGERGVKYLKFEIYQQLSYQFYNINKEEIFMIIKIIIFCYLFIINIYYNL